MHMIFKHCSAVSGWLCSLIICVSFQYLFHILSTSSIWLCMAYSVNTGNYSTELWWRWMCVLLEINCAIWKENKDDFFLLEYFYPFCSGGRCAVPYRSRLSLWKKLLGAARHCLSLSVFLVDQTVSHKLLWHRNLTIFHWRLWWRLWI